jgi:hypothetical protein
MIRHKALACESNPLVETGLGIRVGVDVDVDSLQQSGFFQGLPAPKDRVADDRVVLPQKSGREGLADGLLLKEAK